MCTKELYKVQGKEEEGLLNPQEIIENLTTMLVIQGVAGRCILYRVYTVQYSVEGTYNPHTIPKLLSGVKNNLKIIHFRER